MISLSGKKILIAPSSFAALDKSPLKRLKQAGCEVIDNPFKRKLTKPEIIDLLSNDITGLIAGLEPLDRDVLEASKLKVLSRCGAGMSNVDIEAAMHLGIKVFSTPFGPTNAVAELTIACILSLLRELPLMDKSLHDKRWEKRVGRELKGKKVAIIGFGRIGQRVGRLLAAFDAQVIVVDPVFDGNPNEIHEIQHMTLSDALIEADIVSIHSSGATCMIGKREFNLMKDGVYILNAARGELVDEKELIHAIDSKKVAGAWLDTFSEEPYSGPLCNYPQVTLTPHVGSYTQEGRSQMETEAVENLIKGLDMERH